MNRFFIKVVSILIAGIVSVIHPIYAQNPADGIPLITLNNGEEIPQLGLGTWTLVSTAKDAVDTAVQLGYRMFDSAQGYQTEEGVYQGIQQSGIDRKKVFITTKIAPNFMREGKVRESLDKSLENLGGTYIDLVLIHWPVEGHIKETWQVLEEYVQKGKIKSIGLSNFNPHHYEDLMKYAKIKPVLNQIEIHPYLTQEANVEYFKKRGLAVQCWSPLGSGTILKDEALIEIAEKYKKSVAQIILRWDIQRGLITIPRSFVREELAEDIDIFDFALSDSDMKLISSLNKNQRVNAQNDPDNFPW